MKTMARVPYLDRSDLKAEDQALLDNPLNLTRALVHSPNARRALSHMGRHIRGCSVSPRLREMAVLAVGYLARAPYEWVHHIDRSRDAGVSEDDIHALVDWIEGRPTGLDELTKAVLSAAREMNSSGLAMSDATFAVLRRHLTSEQIVDLIVAIAHYSAMARILASLDIDVEPQFLHLLERFPLPAA